ncbi:MAG TPA: hypothetical protein VFH08_03675 [Chitinophagaceae bacterium]|nr:hypothetical protein [Chitinophagaceae bacterium]
MKTIVMFCLAIAIAGAASAQKYDRHRYSRPRVGTSIRVGIGSPYYYSPFYRPYPSYSAPIYSRPTRLDNEIADIKAEYNDRIWSARHDKSLSKSERKREIRLLKSERDRAIRDAEYNYHRRRY